MLLVTEPYSEQAKVWPREGRHILAQYDDDTIIVYQAYRPSIGRYAAEHRASSAGILATHGMSWVKPNFLWMMYRSGWGSKDWARRSLSLPANSARRSSTLLLAQAVPSSWDRDEFASEEARSRAVGGSSVRLAVGSGSPPVREPSWSGERLTRAAG